MKQLITLILIAFFVLWGMIIYVNHNKYPKEVYIAPTTSHIINFDRGNENIGKD